MSIVVTSIPDSGRAVSISRLIRFGQSIVDYMKQTGRRLVLRTLLGLIALAAILSADAFLRSYKYHSRLIEARLSSGYLTSRPGLYAAARVLRVGQKLSREQLIQALRRAGYLESAASDVWSGSFYQQTDAIEIHPTRTTTRQPLVVRVKFSDGRIEEITANQIVLNSFTLEPEPLSNDLSSKNGKREALSYREIPPVMINAILAIEDRRFFQHSGLDISGLARAVLRNVADERLGQGGSTITQQLVKNTYLTPEKTLRRKYAEAMLAIALERRLSKEDILALYCNEVYLGQRAAMAVRGVKEAARVYFDKDLKDLTLSETATIAGMIQSPARYSPVRNPDEAMLRRNTVLEAMQQADFISAEQVNAAANELISVAPLDEGTNSLAPYFVDYVNRTAESDFEASGFNERIHTTIDLELQQLAEQAVKHQLDRLDALCAKKGNKPQAALIALDPKTGNVLAMVGGRNYAESQLNRATDARRQPGSTFKPFVYAAALEDGMSPVKMFMDAPREFVYDRNRIYRPANYGGGYSMHEVTMRNGLVKSLNVVTVDVALRTGLARIANLAERFGLPKPERYPALALGTEEVTPLQLAAAYGAFVNEGRRVEPKVIASLGEAPGTHAATGDKQVISPTTAYMITNMLSAVIDRGTARKARGAVVNTAIAGKTGTSRDGWFVGYSPNLVCVVWFGYDDNQQLGLTGAEAALPAWVEFMNGAVEMRPDLGGEQFDCPEGIKFIEIDSGAGLVSTVNCPLRELIAVTERTEPSLECYLHGIAPLPVSPIVEEAESEKIVTTQRPGRIEKESSGSEWKRYQLTRVEVDANGRRSLVNEMINVR